MRTRQLMAITLFTMAPATNTERVSKNWLCTLLPIKAIHRGFIGDATAPGNLHLHRHAALRCAYSTSLIPIALSTIRAGHNRTPTERQPNAGAGREGRDEGFRGEGEAVSGHQPVGIDVERACLRRTAGRSHRRRRRRRRQWCSRRWRSRWWDRRTWPRPIQTRCGCSWARMGRSSPRPRPHCSCSTSWIASHLPSSTAPRPSPHRPPRSAAQRSIGRMGWQEPVPYRSIDRFPLLIGVAPIRDHAPLVHIALRIQHLPQVPFRLPRRFVRGAHHRHAPHLSSIPPLPTRPHHAHLHLPMLHRPTNAELHRLGTRLLPLPIPVHSAPINQRRGPYPQQFAYSAFLSHSPKFHTRSASTNLQLLLP